jgi:hypothetical protein
MTKRRTAESAAEEFPPGSEQPQEQAPAGPSEPPRSEASEHARRPIPDPYLIATDTAASVQLLESRRSRQLQIKFDKNPNEGLPKGEEHPALTMLKQEGGFRWNGAERVWAKPYRSDTAYQTRVDAERLFDEVAALMRQGKNAEGRTP